jgi:two-component system LytT family sensor kinase
MKLKSTGFHLLGWALLLAYNLVHAACQNAQQALTQLWLVTAMAVVFYYCYAWVYPHVYKPGRVVLAAIALLPAPFLLMAAQYLPVAVLHPLLFGVTMPPFAWPACLLNSLIYSVLVIVVSGSIWGWQQYFARQQQAQRFSSAALQAGLAYYKAQQNKELLQNALQRLHTMAYPVNDDLAQAIGRLLDFTRFTYTQTADGLVSLEQEITYLKHYLDVYRITSNNNLNIEVTVDSDLSGKRIAPLLFIPLVDNAFVHGVSNDDRRPVKIILKLVAHKLTFTVSNKVFPTLSTPNTNGGLAQVRTRLQYIYPNRHELLMAGNGQTYKVTLHIDL